MTEESTTKETISDIVAAVGRRCVAIAAIVGAVYLIATGHVHEEGWGWLIFLAFFVS